MLKLWIRLTMELTIKHSPYRPHTLRHIQYRVVNTGKAWGRRAGETEPATHGEAAPLSRWANRLGGYCPLPGYQWRRRCLAVTPRLANLASLTQSLHHHLIQMVSNKLPNICRGGHEHSALFHQLGMRQLYIFAYFSENKMGLLLYLVTAKLDCFSSFFLQN